MITDNAGNELIVEMGFETTVVFKGEYFICGTSEL